ncbi:hypothetical protein [Chengkuizengella axinellae]|uniref:DUF4025 domain-containing protein n=1 Tax=Chengkuizengella axinellae TaxID=3064388 RepID=A0ABT9J6S5_9BACL|nr:hypothetical protein [Chengkuizengella sp. 2205SS18-9]MDP5276659.1 hypothetical protein [Chengkuizengella sp. 2205SS18-9]
MAENKQNKNKEGQNEGRENHFMDVDRMVNEGLGGGQVTLQNGLIDESTTDTMDDKNDIKEKSFGE